MLAIMGHMSRKMLERYSHIRMAARRIAVESLVAPKPEPPKSDGVPKRSPQSQASGASKESWKLLILLVSRAGLEPATL
jgi:hypothetical protein